MSTPEVSTKRTEVRVDSASLSVALQQHLAMCPVEHFDIDVEDLGGYRVAVNIGGEDTFMTIYSLVIVGKSVTRVVLYDLSHNRDGSVITYQFVTLSGERADQHPAQEVIECVINEDELLPPIERLLVAN